MTLSDVRMTRISRSRHYLKSNTGKTARLKDKVTTALHKRKLYLTYGMVLCLVTLLTSKRVARVCQHQLSFLFKVDLFAIYSIYCTF